MNKTIETAKAPSFIFTSVGKKYLMALSGLVWAGFTLVHMAGNMLMFVSKDAYNSYGHMLTSGSIIYVVETLLIGSILLHVLYGVALTLQNRKARGPQKYAMTGSKIKGASLSSRTMIFQGTLILMFIILHLITFKFGTHYDTTVNGVVMRDIFRLVFEVFADPIYVAWYSVCLLLLGIHLSHGVGSTLQSLGLFADRDDKKLKIVSWVYGAVVACGFLSQPLYVFLNKGS
jgi:succinate dehydrogenase / fumarate reductase, cytochrome b subunit